MLSDCSLGNMQLSQDVLRTEIGKEAHGARCTEGASLSAAHLRAHAKRGEVLLRNDYCLNLILCLELVVNGHASGGSAWQRYKQLGRTTWRHTRSHYSVGGR